MSPSQPQKSYGALENGLEDEAPKSQEPPRYGTASRVLSAVAIFALGFAAVRVGQSAAKTSVSLQWTSPGSWSETWNPDGNMWSSGDMTGTKSSGDMTGTNWGDGTPSPAPVGLPSDVTIKPNESDTITGSENKTIDQLDNYGTINFGGTADTGASDSTYGDYEDDKGSSGDTASEEGCDPLCCDGQGSGEEGCEAQECCNWDEDNRYCWYDGCWGQNTGGNAWSDTDKLSSGTWGDNFGGGADANSASNPGFMHNAMKGMDAMNSKGWMSGMGSKDMQDMTNLEDWAKTQGAVTNPSGSTNDVPDGTTMENYANQPGAVTNFGGDPDTPDTPVAPPKVYGLKPSEVSTTPDGGTVIDNRFKTSNEDLGSIPAGGTAY